MNLLDLETGGKAKITSITDKEIAFHLMAKGVRVGMVLEVKRRVAFGSSLYLAFENHSMALRNREAMTIYVEKI